MEKQTITIPDGCKAEIRQEDGKTVIVIEEKVKKRWRGEKYDTYYEARLRWDRFETYGSLERGDVDDNRLYRSGNYFRTREEAQAFCDGLNKATKPIFDKAKRGEYDKE